MNESALYVRVGNGTTPMENEFLNSKKKRHTQVCRLLHTKLVSEEKK
jgi:hypothetical protein